ncbi:hypothetical protein [Methyloceanibacter superfactus]|nr:hypothetical protein [Methyloceanibacter superfactus]
MRVLRNFARFFYVPTMIVGLNLLAITIIASAPAMRGSACCWSLP